MYEYVICMHEKQISFCRRFDYHYFVFVIWYRTLCILSFSHLQMAKNLLFYDELIKHISSNEKTNIFIYDSLKPNRQHLFIVIKVQN